MRLYTALDRMMKDEGISMAFSNTGNSELVRLDLFGKGRVPELTLKGNNTVDLIESAIMRYAGKISQKDSRRKSVYVFSPESSGLDPFIKDGYRTFLAARGEKLKFVMQDPYSGEVFESEAMKSYELMSNVLNSAELALMEADDVLSRDELMLVYLNAKTKSPIMERPKELQVV